MKDKNSTLQLALRLFVICAVAALLLAVVYLLTEQPIAQATERARTEAMGAVLPLSKGFDERTDVLLAIENDQNFSTVTGVYEELGGAGYVVSIQTKGYKSGLCLTVGLSPEGSVTGVVITSHNETSGLGSKAAEPAYLEQFYGASGEIVEFDAITVATKSSVAVKDAINTALALYAAQLGGAK